MKQFKSVAQINYLLPDGRVKVSKPSPEFALNEKGRPDLSAMLSKVRDIAYDNKATSHIIVYEV